MKQSQRIHGSYALLCLGILLLTRSALGGQPARQPELPPANASSFLANLENERQALFERVADAVVFMQCEDSHVGSGFFVTDNGLIATNRHVAECEQKLTVVLRTGEKHKAKIVAHDKLYDLALVRIKKLASTPVVLPLANSDEVRIGSYAAAVGHPVGGIWTFTDGMVSNIYAAAKDRYAGIIQAQVPVQPGSSGGPILNRRGEVVGVVTAKLKSGDNMTFCIQSNLLKRLLDEHGNKMNGQLAVDGPVTDAEVLVNGEVKGKVPTLLSLPVGTHPVQVRKGPRKLDTTVKLEAGEVTQLFVKEEDIR